MAQEQCNRNIIMNSNIPENQTQHNAFIHTALVAAEIFSESTLAFLTLRKYSTKVKNTH